MLNEFFAIFEFPNNHSCKGISYKKMYFNRKVNLQFTFLQNAMRGKNKMELRCECSKRFLTDEGINSEE